MIETMKERFFNKGSDPFRDDIPVCECENCINGRFNHNRKESLCHGCLDSIDGDNRFEKIVINGIDFIKIRPFTYNKFQPISFLLELIFKKEDFLKKEEFEI